MKKFYLSAITEKGETHVENQDNYLILYNDKSIDMNDNVLNKKFILGKNDYLLLCVLDGVSSTHNSSLATALVKDKLIENVHVITNGTDEELHLLFEGINKVILNEFDEAATTISVILLTENNFLSFNLGDSPSYILNENNFPMLKISETHTVADYKFKNHETIEYDALYNMLEFYLGNEFDDNKLYIKRGIYDNHSFITSTDGLFKTKDIKETLINIIEKEDYLSTKLFNRTIDRDDDITFIIAKNESVTIKDKIKYLYNKLTKKEVIY